MPALNWSTSVKVVEAQIGRRKHLGQHDDLAGVRQDVKRNLNRFPFFI